MVDSKYVKLKYVKLKSKQFSERAAGFTRSVEREGMGLDPKNEGARREVDQSALEKADAQLEVERSAHPIKRIEVGRIRRREWRCGWRGPGA